MARAWAVVPAAGSGRRMGAQVAKQYLPLLGRPVLAHALAPLFRKRAHRGRRAGGGAR
jgi:2-C-methyl-D-erythritol 4-phosphate cytidylyltransferase